jgi:hypothetical protein
MIERLKESTGGAIGFKVTGRVTAEEVKAFEPQVQVAISQRKNKPIGILADISEMGSVDLKARWEDLRFLSKHSDHIARAALVGAGKWEEIMATIVGGTVLFTAETRYFEPSEIGAAWRWVRSGKHDNDVPVRPVYQGGIWEGYTEEFDV